MKIQANGTEYDIHFQQSKGTGITVCRFMDVRPEEEVETSTLCSHNDYFRSGTGKKVALLRAMKKAGLSKTERLFVWLEYFEETKQAYSSVQPSTWFPVEETC